MSKELINNIFPNFQRYLKIREFDDKIILFAESIFKRRGKNKILVVGNGGSAADEHFVGELTCTYASRSRGHQQIFECITTVLTAWGNDFGFEHILRDKSKLSKEGDLLVCISTGGGDKKSNASMNIVHAAIEAKQVWKLFH